MASCFLLHAAAAAGDLSKVEELLTGGTHGDGIRLNIDDLDLQGRCEHIVCVFSETNWYGILTVFGRTVLHVACEAGRDEVCRRLLQEPGDAKTNALYSKVRFEE